MSRDSQSITSEQPSPEQPLGGRYKIISQLGAGGFGHTFLAEDLHLPGHPRCVIKKLLPQNSDPESLVMARRLFDTEAQVLYQLGDHDQIPRLLAHFEENQEFYLAQEFIEGEPLTKELAKRQIWTETQIIDFFQDILQVLAFVHEQQVIHRDLKPANLMRRRSDGKIVLIDFGAVKQVSNQVVNPETEETNLTISIGTKGYMPNEQLAGTPRFSSDVYAVGMIAIQVLTGKHPKRIGEDPQTSEIDWRKHAPHVSSELADIVDNMVRYDFRDRYPTATQALEALQDLLSSRPGFIAVALPSREEREASSRGELNNSSNETEQTEIELEPTNIWVPVPTETPVQTAAGSLEITASLSQQDSPLPSPETTLPTSRPVGFIHQQLVKFWPWLAILVAVVTTFTLTKAFLSSQVADSSGNRSNTGNPIPTPTGVSTVKPKPPPPKPKAEDLLSEAKRLQKAKQYEQALKLYDQAIALKPKLAEAYWGRCYSLNKLQKPAEALVACNDALDLKRNYPEALWGKADAYYQQNLSIQALQLYERATRRKPDMAEAWVRYGIALQSVGRSVEAIRALDKGIAIDRTIAEAWSTKGDALQNLGRFDEAIAALDKALQLQPDDRKSLKLRQHVQKQLGR
ncbi:MAG TPA: serine/threonine-protein kinase [Coleofasciculaceae cyanobacterium]